MVRAPSRRGWTWDWAKSGLSGHSGSFWQDGGVLRRLGRGGFLDGFFDRPARGFGAGRLQIGLDFGDDFGVLGGDVLLLADVGLEVVEDGEGAIAQRSE